MKNKALSIIMSILGATFSIFTFNCLLLNIIFSLVYEGNLLKIEVNLIMLAISLLISLIITYFLYKKDAIDAFLKIKSVYIASFIFSIAFFAEFFSFLVLLQNNLTTYKWSLPLIFITLLFAICEGIIIQLVKINNLLIKIPSQLLLTGALYFSVVIGFFGLGNGNTLLPVIAVYLTLFVAVTALLSLIDFLVKKNKDNKKEYTKQF